MARTRATGLLAPSCAITEFRRRRLNVHRPSKDPFIIAGAARTMRQRCDQPT
ncbi:hypothetical protein ACQEV9_44300 [Streptomyces chartreusis]|uniref:hypothetical protein n=1 Tax=Streptomyces chartreusis TaxID=1969 RepID=UPI003D912C4C